ncbi:MAG: RluA family pseudouridine synthase [Alphaproteobacteria bacterium]|nr:RluA family pseudouridine synthase [Alphaproteobacteria bacterium]
MPTDPAPAPAAAPAIGQHQVTITPAIAGDRLDRALAAELATTLPGLSRSRVKALIEAGAVSLDRATISDPSRRVKDGETYRLALPPAAPAGPEAQAIALAILYEDDELIVLDKPAGMVVHPAPGNPDRTLVNALLAHCGDSLSGIGGEKRPGIVHRLDKDTSGVMVVAKTDRAHAALSHAFASRALERAYLALVWGLPSPLQGEVAGAIGRHPRDRKKMAVVGRGGKAALTRYKVLEAFGGVASLVECRLATGRTHQIRVHMAAIGHPVVGDPVYGSGARASRRGSGNRTLAPIPAPLRERLASFPRQALHAGLIGFVHPASGELLRFTSALPNDFNELLSCLRSCAGKTFPD